MKIKIVSNGLPQDTHLVDAETGERVDIGPVGSIDWRIEVGNYAEATIRIAGVAVEATSECQVQSAVEPLEATRTGIVLNYLRGRGVSEHTIASKSLDELIDLAGKHLACEQAYG